MYRDRVREIWSGAGTGDVVLGGVPDTTFVAFGTVMTNGQTTDVAIFGAGGYETCPVTYVTATNKLVRGTPYASSNGGAAVDFGPGTKVVIMFLPASKAVTLDAGTIMLFQQTTAPVGFTKLVTHNDKALRVVSGAAGSGGSSAFSTVFGKTATDNVTLSAGNHATHSHVQDANSVSRQATGAFAYASDTVQTYTLSITSLSTANQGSGTAFSAGMDIRVQYIDLILASKD